jgi:DNA-binding phage protein
MRIFELADVILLLRSEVKQAGGQTAWAKKNGINRTILNMVLKGRRAPNKAILRALKLRMVFVDPPRYSS